MSYEREKEVWLSVYEGKPIVRLYEREKTARLGALYWQRVLLEMADASTLRHVAKACSVERHGRQVVLFCWRLEKEVCDKPTGFEIKGWIEPVDNPVWNCIVDM